MRNRRGLSPEGAGWRGKSQSERGIRALSLLDATATVPRSGRLEERRALSVAG